MQGQSFAPDTDRLCGVQSGAILRQGSRPICREPTLVEAGGQHIRGFRCGLDYAFIRGTRESTRMRSVLSG